MENILVPVWSLSLNPEILEDFEDMAGMDQEQLLNIARIHRRCIMNDFGEVVQGFGLIVAYRLLGREYVHVFIEAKEAQMWGADMKGFEIRTGPDGQMRVV